MTGRLLRLQRELDGEAECQQGVSLEMHTGRCGQGVWWCSNERLACVRPCVGELGVFSRDVFSLIAGGQTQSLLQAKCLGFTSSPAQAPSPSSSRRSWRMSAEGGGYAGVGGKGQATEGER